MELVYLWVENYKNIQKQGFNFSPRFKCEYDENTNELIIDENKNYVSIFPDNINVTAIVGENGSGKSSILLGITNNKILIQKNDRLYTTDFASNKYKFDEINRVEDYDIVYIDYDLIKLHQVKDFWDYSLQNIYDKNIYRKIENASGWDSNFNIAKFREHFFNIIVEHIDSFNLKVFFYNPIKISFTDYIHSVNTKEDRFNHINKLINDISTQNFTKEKFLVFLYSNISMKIPPNITKVDTIPELLKIEDNIIENAEYYKLDNITEIYEFLNELNNTEMLISEFNGVYKKYKKAFLKLVEIGYLQIDFEDEIRRKYFDLSFGERKFFTEMLMIFNEIKCSKNDNIFIVLDEPDLTLHPDWQKKYISEMIKLLTSFKRKRFHLIITSHSPFILSDLPKENIIFLEKGKQVYPFDDGKQTFGANIHTLLSHGFFMKDGLMGEFAKEKIDLAITYLNQKTLTQEELDYCENIISIIGEPIIKRELQRMLNNKRLSKIDKIDEIEKQIEELQKELKKIKND